MTTPLLAPLVESLLTKLVVRLIFSRNIRGAEALCGALFRERPGLGIGGRTWNEKVKLVGAVEGPV